MWRERKFVGFYRIKKINCTENAINFKWFLSKSSRKMKLILRRLLHFVSKGRRRKRESDDESEWVMKEGPDRWAWPEKQSIESTLLAWHTKQSNRSKKESIRPYRLPFLRMGSLNDRPERGRSWLEEEENSQESLGQINIFFGEKKERKKGAEQIIIARGKKKKRRRRWERENRKGEEQTSYTRERPVCVL